MGGDSQKTATLEVELLIFRRRVALLPTKANSAHPFSARQVSKGPFGLFSLPKPANSAWPLGQPAEQRGRRKNHFLS